MKSVLVLLAAVAGVFTKKLDYSFKINGGRPELEVVKSEGTSKKKHSKDSKHSKKLSDYQMIQMNPTMAPMIELGDILKEFTKVMRHKSKHRRRKKEKSAQQNQDSTPQDKRKLNVIKTADPAQDQQMGNSLSPNSPATPQNNANNLPSPPNRKAMGLGAIGGIAAGAGGAALVGGAMAGSAQNEGLEHEIMAKENTFGIMKIQEKVNDDINMELFSTSVKFKGLREKAKTVLLNGEQMINQIEDQMDNSMGNLQAMDKHLYNTFKKEEEEEGD